MLLQLVCTVQSLDFPVQFHIPELWNLNEKSIRRALRDNPRGPLSSKISISFSAAKTTQKETEEMVSIIKTSPREFEKVRTVNGINYLHYTKKLLRLGKKELRIGSLGCIVYSRTNFVEASISFQVEPSRAEILAAKKLLNSISW